MPVETKLWRIDGGFTELSSGPIAHEERLEGLLAEHPEVLDEDLLVVGTQIPTAFGSRIDLLAVDSEGDVVVVELKPGRTPRDVDAQVLDMARGSVASEMTK